MSFNDICYLLAGLVALILIYSMIRDWRIAVKEAETTELDMDEYLKDSCTVHRPKLTKAKKTKVPSDSKEWREIEDLIHAVEIKKIEEQKRL